MSSLIQRAWMPASAAMASAGRDLTRGVLIVGRGTIGLTGIAALLAALALLGSEQVREQAFSAVISATGSIVAESSRVIEEVRPDVEPPGNRRNDWLSARPSGTAEPAQENVTRYLSRRYRVADNAVRQIVGEAFSTGRSIGVDPLLILAVTAVESSLNPFAQSPLGAQGLMQIMTHVHSDRFAAHGGDNAALDPIANLKVGSEILKEMIRRGGSVERGLQLYVGAGNAADDSGYAGRVLGEMSRIKLAATGDVRVALSESLRTANGPGGPASADLMPAGARAAAPSALATADFRSI